MIRTRILFGTLLALGAAGVLIGDTVLAHRGAAYFPCLFAALLLLSVLGTRELLNLLPAPVRPSAPLTICGVLLMVAANWYPIVRREFSPDVASPWAMFVVVSVGVLLCAFLVEMHRYTGEPGLATPRLAYTAFAVAYLGLIPGFFAQVRWLHDDATTTAIMLTLVIFVPKCNDIGAFFTGTFIGRHRMTPILSPKKTWEGVSGGMVAGALVAVGLSFAAPVFSGIAEAAAFGLVVGLAGVLGDLGESMLKRDFGAKDAAQSIPGFGGVLDVVDSVLFAAPVAYLWFRLH